MAALWPPPRKLGEGLLDACLKPLGCEYGELWHAPESGAPLRMLACAARDASAARFGAASRRFDFDQKRGIVGAAARSRSSSILPDLSRSRAFERRLLAERAGLRSGIVVPLWERKALVGVAAFFGRAGRVPASGGEAALRAASQRLAAAMGRLRADERLRGALRFVDSLIENMPGIIFVKDARELRYVRLNKASEELLGYDRRELLGRNDYDLFPKEQADSFTAKDREALEGREPVEIPEEPIQTRRRGLRTLRTQKIPVPGADGRPAYLLGISEDITEKKRAAEELARTEEQLRASQRLESVGRLAGGVAHEFNNILTGINGLACLLLEDLEAGRAKPGDLREISAACGRAAELVSQLLTFSRHRPPRRRPCDLSSVVGGLRGIATAAVRDRLRLRMTLARGLPGVLADPAQVQQVLLNLLINAADASPAGGTGIVQTSAVTLDRPRRGVADRIPAGRYVALRVLDEGKGVSEDIRAHLFEPFFTTKPAGKGSGLGLAVVYGILRQHGGYVDVLSEDGGGSSFETLWPALDRPAPSGKDGPGAAGEAAPARGETVLLAEDDPVPREVLRRVLERYGYRVLLASDGDEAVRLFMADPKRVDAVLLDMRMPRLDGWKVYERLRDCRPDVRAMFLSGRAPQDADREALRSGLPYLQKPFPPEELARRLREVLDAR